MTVRHSFVSTFPDDPNNTLVGSAEWNAEHVDTQSVTYFGAVGDGVTDDTAAIQSAIDAVAATGGTLLFPAGTYLVSGTYGLSLPYGLTNKVMLSGYGATIKRSGTMRHLFCFDNDDTDNVTFRNLTIAGFTFDCASTSVLAVIGRKNPYVNYNDIAFRDLTFTGNVYDENAATQNWSIHLGQRARSTAVSHTTKNIIIDNCHSEGGGNGFGVVTDLTGTSINCYMDKVFISNCSHDTLVTPTKFAATTGHIIGGEGIVGTVGITGCTTRNSGDNGFEINNARVGKIDACRSVNAYSAHFTMSNKVDGADTEDQAMSVVGCTASNAGGLPTAPFVSRASISYVAQHGNGWQHRTTAPASNTWVAGDLVYNQAPSAGGYAGWICVTGGTPGTWAQFGSILP